MLGYSCKNWHEKAPCICCGRRVRAGAVAPGDLGDPPARALCFVCLNLFLEDPHEFEQRMEAKL